MGHCQNPISMLDQVWCICIGYYMKDSSDLQLYQRYLLTIHAETPIRMLRGESLVEPKMFIMRAQASRCHMFVGVDSAGEDDTACSDGPALLEHHT